MKIGVLLNGCGHRDGSEIREAVLALTALDEQGWAVQCLSPDAPQASHVNHWNGEREPSARNMLAESARIARGEIQPLAAVEPENLRALLIPGGFGTAMNLCDFASAGHQMKVHPEVAELIRAMHAARKPIAAICIAPVLLAKVLGSHGIRLTVGDDPEVSLEIRKMGAKVLSCPRGSCVVDEEHRIVTTPAYMYGDSNLRDVFGGIKQMTLALKRWLD